MATQDTRSLGELKSRLVKAETPAEKAKHARFLAARGFNTATIMKVLNASDEDFAAD